MALTRLLNRDLPNRVGMPFVFCDATVFVEYRRLTMKFVICNFLFITNSMLGVIIETLKRGASQKLGGSLPWHAFGGGASLINLAACFNNRFFGKRGWSRSQEIR